MNISLCKSCIDLDSSELSTFGLSVLYHLATVESPYKIISDESGIILDSYREIIEESDNIAFLNTWLTLIAANKKIRTVKTPENNDENSISIGVLKETLSSRNFITSNAELINNNRNDICAYDINVIEKCDASTFLHSRITQDFSYDKLLQDIITQLSQMMTRKYSLRLEDLHNDAITNKLQSLGYQASDQPRVGSSDSENTTSQNPGELDIFIKRKNGNPVSIVEALRESSCGERNRNISKHLNKLLNKYDACGLKRNFFIVYCEQANFLNFWTNYKDYMENINDKPDFSGSVPQISFEDTEESLCEYTDIRIGRGIYQRNGRDIEVYHIVCNMYV